MKKISIKDIARQAGVAPSTVSCVINGKAKERRISDELARSIETIARKAGFRPNSTAVSLRTGKSNILGLIVEDISNPFFAKLAKAIEDEAYLHGYKLLYCSTENNDSKGNELVKTLLDQQVDGFLITPCKGMKKSVADLLKQKKPVVLMDRHFPDIKASSVTVHNYKGVKEGMKHLAERGYTNISFITVDLDQVQMHERENAYHDAVEELGFPFSKVLKMSYDQPHQAFVDQIAGFIQENPGADALFFATNYLGVYGLESIGNLELSIPQDLAIVCFDDHDFFKIYKPSITVIEQPIHEMAVTAVGILIRNIESGSDTDKKTNQEIKETRLIVRNST